MEIKSSYEVAEEYAKRMNPDDELLCSFVSDIKNIEEKNFLMGREIFSDTKSMLAEYYKIVKRDGENVLEIALSLKNQDESTLSDIINSIGGV